jgi:hypothetical protein
MGYQVWYVIRHSGYKKQVYWSRELNQARDYAFMVAKNQGENFGVFICTDNDVMISEWNLLV